MSSLNLKWINPEDLGDYWDLITPGLKAVNKYGDHWRIEDVYVSLKLANSNLHIGYINREYIGFIITTPEKSYDGANLHIWALYSEGGQLEEGMPQIEEWAKTMNAKRITFKSPRKGWAKIGEKLGFKPTMVIWEKEL